MSFTVTPYPWRENNGTTLGVRITDPDGRWLFVPDTEALAIANALADHLQNTQRKETR